MPIDSVITALQLADIDWKREIHKFSADWDKL